MVENSKTGNFLEITENKPPSLWLLEAINILGRKGIALDLGCGAGRDVKFLLEHGFTVTAVDQESKTEEYIKKLPQENLFYVNSAFENFNFEKEKYNLINAQFSLPFIDRNKFNEVFSRMKKSLKFGGVFVGQLFGVNDDWNKSKTTRMTFHTKEEVLNLLSDMELIKFMEKDYDGTLADGTAKHWHMFHVIGRKDHYD